MLSRNAGLFRLGLLLVVVAVLFIGFAAIPTASAQTADPPEVADPVAAMHVSANPESCSVCHKDAGEKHQASYDVLYQDEVIQVTDMAYSYTEPDMSTVTFSMTKNGAPFNWNDADSKGMYFAAYADGKFQFEPAIERLSILKGDAV